MNPINLIIRFLLEMSALAAMGVWGWSLGCGLLQYISAVGIPIIAASIWGTFNVLGDPSRNGEAPVKVPGILRFAIELIFFFVAAWMLYDRAYTTLSLTIIAVVIVHYIASYERIKWLMAH